MSRRTRLEFNPGVLDHQHDHHDNKLHDGFRRSADRQAVPEKYKWNLADLYPSEAAWTKAKDELAHRLPELAKYRGHLGKSPQRTAGGPADDV